MSYNTYEIKDFVEIYKDEAIAEVVVNCRLRYGKSADYKVFCFKAKEYFRGQIIYRIIRNNPGITVSSVNWVRDDPYSFITIGSAATAGVLDLIVL